MPKSVRKFSAQTAWELKHYVYALIDTRDRDGKSGEVFYVGKGQGNRCFAHAAWAEKDADFPERTGEDLKADTIKDIQKKTGADPEVKIVAHGFEHDKEALRIEAILITAFGLTNKQSGHHAGDYWRTVKELETAYGDPVLRSELDGTVVLVSLNESYPEAKDSESKLEEKTLGDWNVPPEKAGDVDLVIGVYRELMVSFYRTKKNGESAVFEETNRNNRKKGEHLRVRWRGVRADDLAEKYAGRSLELDDAGDGNGKLSKIPSGSGRRYLPRLPKA